MLSVSTALARLQDGLGESFPDLPGTRIIDVAFPLNDAFDPLLWCGQQAQWPQFYWQQRNGDEELATLGAVKTFFSLDAANRFLRQAGRQDLRICGLNAFEPQQGSLALPRLEWRRCGGRAVLRLVLHSDISLREDAATARAFLASLTTTQATPGAIPPLLSERHSSDYPQWQSMIARATKAISAGEMDKVVLARATDLQFAAPLDAVSIMAASRRSNLNCFHFLMAFNARQAFFGSTPERLWRRRGALLRTEALAGTVANHQEDAKAQQLADWLMKDDKNQRENMLVVEDICQRLQSEASTLDVLPPQVVRLRKVQHLRRCIWTELAAPDDSRCLLQLQPTAAVAGLPRRAALAFIQRHEPFSREWYAGSAGYLSLAQSEFCVALRSAKVDHDTLRLYAGAGIVSGSDAQQEWQEIDNKAAGLRSLLCP
ncbi:isochorismate synthase MenF [Klebsiella pneumoniae]|uniref:isochorismate synthase MenF n=1 Tax=Klebsiella pneumoniae TaxID=573 RepID=UPI000DE758DC|nr:isochorismate synthase MenF [Klebsiella pneumoniae]MDE4717967.1 isochorismate synthase MenF [Klebsiella pneumoniae]MDE4852220.1 isochorismate synthase MenF [Klebsiella pneumoniae]SSH60789.1 menaquinone-specific isochorismate synthase [Klebsiella pneumoniae]HDY7164480.1 isochorismate synthase MenF [Klebsiella pneumoniae]